MPATALNATVSHRRDLTPELAMVRVRPDEGPPAPFEPGQFATLGLPADDDELVKRVYSIASPPGLDHLEFYIQLVKHGELTRRLWPLVEGDRLFLSPKIAGRFTLDGVPADADVVLVGTGTGLAPFVSMARHFCGRERWRSAVVVHGVRFAADLGYRDALEALCRQHDGLRYLPLVTREPDGSAWSGLRGRVQTLLEGDTWERLVGAPLDPARAHVFLCGNPAMIDDMERALVARGFATATQQSPGNLHFERYW